MSSPEGSDRIQEGVPTASGTGDNSSTGTDSFDDVPLTRDEAIERDSAQDDDLPAHADSDVSRAQGAGAASDPDAAGPRFDDRTQR
jgi:hypothetical protein